MTSELRCFMEIAEMCELYLQFFGPSDEDVLECMPFCFTALIRGDLSSIKSNWNVHIIS